MRLCWGSINWNDISWPQKAFHTINQEILFKKLKAMGFSEGYITRFQSYLSERIFFRSIENQFSDYGRMSCGVPQGLYFSLFFSVTCLKLWNSNLLLYADDSCLIFQHKEVEQIEKVINHDFDKTNSILFASQRKEIKTAYTDDLSRLCYGWNCLENLWL